MRRSFLACVFIVFLVHFPRTYAQETSVFPVLRAPVLQSTKAGTPSVRLDGSLKVARLGMTAPDLSRVFVVLPPASAGDLSSGDVLAQTVIPLLRLGRPQIDPRSVRPTSMTGIRLPQANLAALARLLAAEYQGRENVTPQATLDLVAGFAGLPLNEAAEQQLRRTRGKTLAQFKADIERQEIVYPFVQLIKDVPIEHTMLVASRYEGEGITRVTGSLIARPRVINEPVVKEARAVEAGSAALATLPGIDEIDRSSIPESPRHFLLPFGNLPGNTVVLRHVWRMVLLARAKGQTVPYRIWVDAGDGRLLQALPLLAAAKAAGQAWKRDPGTATIVPREFEVDDADQTGTYFLRHSPMGLRLDFGAFGLDPTDLSVQNLREGGDVDFTLQVTGNPAQAACKGGDDAFKQVHLFSTIYLYRDYALGLAMYTPFPALPWTPKLDSGSLSCNSFTSMSYSNMEFGVCPGYSAPNCPDAFPVGTGPLGNFLNYGLDNTIVGHELGHNIVKRLTIHRPEKWCGATACPSTIGLLNLHDLADAWADHLEDTNCTGGWVAKNGGGSDASLNCNGSHDELSSLPRLHQVSVPFDGAKPGDHFPEHRSLNNPIEADYADMQIAAAALWQVREGVRSIDRASGHIQYGARLALALRASKIATDPGTSDLGIYELLLELETKMLEQWATAPGGGDPAVNKVAAGFAKVGVFAIPAACIDGDPNSTDARACPAAEKGENGGDAVIDVDDGDASDDLVLEGIVHKEVDYLRLTGPAPIFHIWTGPRYVFNVDSARPLPGQSPCNTRFQVELANDPGFALTPTVVSGDSEGQVTNDNGSDTSCYKTWSPSEAQWAALQVVGEGGRIYYRVRTTDSRGGRERSSLRPAAGMWTVSPPFATLTISGGPNF